MSELKREIGYWMRCGALAMLVGVSAWLFVQVWRNWNVGSSPKGATVQILALPCSSGPAVQEPACAARFGVEQSPQIVPCGEIEARSLTVKWISPISVQLEGGRHLRLSARSTSGGDLVSLELSPARLLIPNSIPDGHYVLDNTQDVDFLGAALVVTGAEVCSQGQTGDSSVIYLCASVTIVFDVVDAQNLTRGSCDFGVSRLLPIHIASPSNRLKLLLAQCERISVSIGSKVSVVVRRLPLNLVTLGNPAVAVYDIVGGESLLTRSPEPWEEVRLTVVGRSIVRVRLFDDNRGEWGRFVSESYKVFVEHNEQLVKQKLAFKPPSGWTRDAVLYLSISSASTGQVLARERVHRESIDTLQARGGEIVSGDVRIKPPREAHGLVVMRLMYCLGTQEIILGLQLIEFQPSGATSIDFPLGLMIRNAAISVKAGDDRGIAGQQIALTLCPVQYALPETVLVGRIGIWTTGDDGLSLIPLMVVPADCRLVGEFASQRKEATHEVLRRLRGEPALVFQFVADGAEVVHVLRFQCLSEGGGEWAGYYHILPTIRNTKLQADSGIISLDAHSRLSTNISEAGQYQCLFVGKFGCVYEEVAFDGTQEIHRVRISKPIHVAVDTSKIGSSGEPVVAIPKRVPMVVCWALCRRFVGMEHGVFPMHVSRQGRLLIPAQIADSSAESFLYWSAGSPFTSDCVRERVSTISVEIPSLPGETEYILILTPIFHVGAKNDDALAAYGIQIGLKKTPCSVPIGLPRGKYWLAALALPRNKPPSVVAIPSGGSVVEVDDGGGKIRLQLR